MKNKYNINPSISIKDFLEIILPYWRSEEKWKAILFLSISIVLVFSAVGTNVYLSNLNKDFFDAIQNYNLEIITKSLIILIIIFTLFAFISSYKNYIFSIMQIRWRRWLTHFFLKKWFTKNAYYQMETFSDTLVDNPDQRISSDIDSFITLSSNLFLVFLSSILTFFSFAYILWNLSSPVTIPLWNSFSFTIYGYLFWSCIIFTLIATWVTIKIGRPLIRLSFFQEKYEANFRYNLVKNRDHSEQISIYKAEIFELNGHEKRFHNIIINYIELAKRNKIINIFSIIFDRIASFFPLIIALPGYFAKKYQYGGMVQITISFAQVYSALSFFMHSYTDIAKLINISFRLNEFLKSCSKIRMDKKTEQFFTDKKIFYRITKKNTLTLKNIDIYKPDLSLLIQNLSIQIEEGEKVLIMGKSGKGKSSLLRAIAGIWPFASGQIELPKKANFFFLPQKSYLPTGTLAEVLQFPKIEQKIPHEILKQILYKCGLTHLRNFLDAEENWSAQLSVGEQQRIGFARVLLHKPNWFFLDEATSALDEPYEKIMYEHLQYEIENLTIISVGHRASLEKLHTRVINI